MDGTAASSPGTAVRSNSPRRPASDHRCATTVNPPTSSTADSQSKKSYPSSSRAVRTAAAQRSTGTSTVARAKAPPPLTEASPPSRAPTSSGVMPQIVVGGLPWEGGAGAEPRRTGRARRTGTDTGRGPGGGRTGAAARYRRPPALRRAAPGHLPAQRLGEVAGAGRVPGRVAPQGRLVHLARAPAGPAVHQHRVRRPRTLSGHVH